MQHTPGGARREADSYLPGTWPGGSTRAIVADPPEALAAPADARYWVGTAVIARAAPYSYFPGRVRLHIPIRGEGIRLRFREPDELVVLDRLDQHRFDGARPVDVELQAGPVVALNLIVRADVMVEAQVVAVAGEEFRWALADASAGMEAIRLIYVVAGSLLLRTGEGDALSLAADDCFVFDLSGVPAPPPSLVAGGLGQAEVVLATLWLRADDGR